MNSTIWSFAAPADRETLMAAGIAWLLDPTGSHDLQCSILGRVCQRANIPVPPPESVRIIPEESPSRDKRFDISVFSDGARLLVIEVKCKTFGFRSQILTYQTSAKAVVRFSFGEWNWPDLTDDDRSTFPLITFEEVGQWVLSSLNSGSSAQHSTSTEFAQHLIAETQFLNQLYGYFITADVAARPAPPSTFRYSERFLNQLYWSWVEQKGKRIAPQIFNWCKSKSESSGVWLLPFYAEISAGEQRRLPMIPFPLSGPLEFWLHVELLNRTGLLAKSQENVGDLRLRIAGDAASGQLDAILKEFGRNAVQLHADGWRLPGRSPHPGQGSCSVLIRSLTLDDFRFPHLVALMERIIGDDL